MTAIVIGGGTNGLAAALRLARTGRRVILFEASDALGGLAASRTFHPGFRSAGFLDSAAVDNCGVAMGLVGTPSAEAVALAPSGHVTPLSAAPLDAWLASHRALLAAVLTTAPPRIDPAAPLAPLVRLGIDIRRGGVSRMRELLRVPVLSAEDWLVQLGLDAVSRGLVQAPALLGGVVGPRQPTTAAQVILNRARGALRITGPAAVAALTASARTAGVDLRLGTPVTQVRTEAGAVVGVTLADGTSVDASTVIAAIDPRATLLGLLDPWSAGTGLRRIATPIRARGSVAQLLLAVSSLPPGCPSSAWVGTDPKQLEQAFDARKYGTFAPTPAGVHLTVPSAMEAGLAPSGSATVSIRWIAAPADGWSPEQRQRTSDALIAAIDAVIPAFSHGLLARELVAPPDLASQFGSAHPFHAEHALDQVWAGRPAFGLGHYATPVRGLYLGSAGTHPGGGVVGTSGWLAGGAVT